MHGSKLSMSLLAGIYQQLVLSSRLFVDCSPADALDCLCEAVFAACSRTLIGDGLCETSYQYILSSAGGSCGEFRLLLLWAASALLLNESLAVPEVQQLQV